MMELREISASTLANNLRLSVACLCLVAAAATPAFAFRPFDGTDAAVVDPRKMENELRPAGRLHDESRKSPGGQFFGAAITSLILESCAQGRRESHLM
jgi:hypothetical protein